MSRPVEPLAAIQDIAQRANNLYSLPGVAVKVLDLTRQPTVDAQAIKECIENDPALTGKLLRVVNSSLFGLSGEICDLNHALALLGVKPLKLLVLGFSLPQDLFDDVEAEVLERYWRHALVKSVACREISNRCFRSGGDEVFVAGLLQRIGMLVLVQQLGTGYVEFLDRVHRHGGDLCSLEQAALGFDHTAVSAELLKRWKLPKKIIQMVSVPHQVERILALPKDQRVAAQSVHLAELVTLLVTGCRADVLEEMREASERYGGITIEQWTSLMSLLEDKVQQLADVLSLRPPGQQDYSQVLLDAYSQLSETVEEAVGQLARDPNNEHWTDQARSLRGALARLAEGRVSAPIPTTPAPLPQAVAAVTAGGAAVAAPARSDLNQTFAGDPGLAGHVALAVADCRHDRAPLSFALLHTDQFEALCLQAGPDRAAYLMARLSAMVESLAEPPNQALVAGDDCFAVLLRDYDRPQGVAAIKRMINEIRDWARLQPETSGRSIAVNAGLATLSLPPSNFAAEDLVQAAERCLYAAQSTDGGVVKSIEIY